MFYPYPFSRQIDAPTRKWHYAVSEGLSSPDCPATKVRKQLPRGLSLRQLKIQIQRTNLSIGAKFGVYAWKHA